MMYIYKIKQLFAKLDNCLHIDILFMFSYYIIVSSMTNVAERRCTGCTRTEIVALLAC